MLSRGFMFLLAVLALTGLLWTPGSEADNRVFVVVATEGDFGGMARDTFEKQVTALLDVGAAKADAEFEFRVVSGEEAVKQYKEGEIDIIFSGITYEMTAAWGIDPRPLAVLATGGNATQRTCLYLPPESDIKSVADLQGQVIQGSNLTWGTASLYHLLRKIVFDAGFDAPLDEFFGEIKHFHGETKAAFDAVAAGDGKAVYLLDSYKRFYRTDKVIAQFEELACSPPFTQSLIMARRDLDPEFVQTFRTIIANAHRDPAFAAFRFIFLAVDGAMVLVDDEDYQPNIELYEEALERGWIKEVREP